MTMITGHEARDRLDQLIDEAAQNHIPVTIVGKRHDAVLISAADWQSIQESLHSHSLPGLAESIHAGPRIPPGEYEANLCW